MFHFVWRVWFFFSAPPFVASPFACLILFQYLVHQIFGHRLEGIPDMLRLVCFFWSSFFLFSPLSFFTMNRVFLKLDDSTNEFTLWKPTRDGEKKSELVKCLLAILHDESRQKVL